jgi:hypothetical protein
VSERVLHEETWRGSVQALAEVFLLVQPAAFGRAMRLRRHVSDIARSLGVMPKWDIEIPALLSQVGSVALSPPGRSSPRRERYRQVREVAWRPHLERRIGREAAIDSVPVRLRTR